MKKQFFYLYRNRYMQCLEFFSMDPDPDFRPIRIRTPEKSSIRIREKNRIRNTAFFADPNPAVVLNAEPDPDVIRIQL